MFRVWGLGGSQFSSLSDHPNVEPLQTRGRGLGSWAKAYGPHGFAAGVLGLGFTSRELRVEGLSRLSSVLHR